MMRYTIGISDGMSWNAGGEITIVADSIDDAREDANAWADEGDYPCLPPVTVTIVLRDPLSGAEIERWQHRVPDAACTGSRE